MKAPSLQTLGTWLPGLIACGAVLSSVVIGEPFLVAISSVGAAAAIIVTACLLLPIRRSWKAMPPPLAALAVVASVAVTHWPLRLACHLSENRLDTLAARVAAGESLPMPQQAGIITVRKAEVSNHGIVCLWTRPDPGSNTGFVRTPPDQVPFNLWSMVSIDRKWQFISED